MQQKRFLDTSVLRKLLFGTQAYRDYLKDQFKDDPLFISAYVKMEFKRSFIISLIGFYNVLNMPSIENTSDALRFWSNEYRNPYLKAIHELISDFLANQNLISDSAFDKAKALLEIGRLIKRYMAEIRMKFKDTGIDSTRCAREQVPFKIDRYNMESDFEKYVMQFKDVKACRQKCNIHTFLDKKKSKIETLITEAQKLSKTRHTKGFINISENLNKILNEGYSKCTCSMCGKIGDAVIALDAPTNMQIESLDHSFDYLCPPLRLENKKHPSESQLHKKINR